MSLPRLDRGAVLAAAVCLAIGLGFWTGSRYPDLGEKAALGGGVVLEDPLGFEAVEQVDGADPFGRKLVQTTVNWVATNRRGMVFGVLLAAGFMTLFRRISRRSFEGSFSNSLLGVVIGTPLGVCVNCAAPIARGLHASGARLETSLAAMISSPTLNFIVVGMLFSMFPTRLALLKLVLGLAFVLVLIPLLSQLVFRRERLAGADAARLAELSHTRSRALTPDPLAIAPGWGEAARAVALDFAANLWFIVKQTLPLMLLAGLLGALAVTLLPWETLVASLPRDDSWASLGWMALIGAFGLLLPVPMAFDVVVSAALFAAGMPASYVMVLLFSLGIFSVYSFLIVWQATSLRVAATLAFVLWGLSVAAGGAASVLERRDGERQAALFAALRAADPPARAQRKVAEAGPDLPLLADLRAEALRFEPMPEVAEPGIRVERLRFAERSGSGSGSALFSRHYGETFGIERDDRTPVVFKFQRPFYSNWPVAAGDVHGDGRPDLLIGSDGGPRLYANRGAEGFALQRVDIPELRALRIANAALVDLDGDGWLDIVVSAYRGGNHLIRNDRGRFSREGWQRLPETGANLANAMSFADVDRNGRLDVLLANWTSGRYTARPPEASRDTLLLAGDGGYRELKLSGPPGESLSSYIFDLNLDGRLDLVVANGFHEVADTWYLGDGRGGFTPIRRSDGVIPFTGSSTMSIDLGDVDNDLVPEIYLGQITGRRRGQSLGALEREVPGECAEHTDPHWRERCERHGALHEVMRDTERLNDASLCLSIRDAEPRGDCVAYAMMRQSVRRRDRTGCGRIPQHWEPLAFVCEQAFRKRAPAPAQSMDEIRQRDNQNFLLARQPDGSYRDRGEEMGVEVGGWTWNARFADLDNDGWQDLYMVNGFFSSSVRESSLFYRNLGGERFEQATEAAGLVGFEDSYSFAYLDMDQDGDLDIVTQTGDGPVWVHRNESVRGHSIAIELADELGNHFGIGSRIVVHHGPGAQRHQLREIKAGGGYLSFDPPEAHFGLGEDDRVARIDVHWSTGGTTSVRGEFAAGYRYRIQRAREGGVLAFGARRPSGTSSGAPPPPSPARTR